MRLLVALFVNILESVLVKPFLLAKVRPFIIPFALLKRNKEHNRFKSLSMHL